MLSLAVHVAQLAAAASLLAAARRAPSLRTASRAMAVSLPLDALLHLGRDDGRALYHLAQASQGAWLSLVLLAAYAPPRSALACWCLFAAAALWWWPAPATPLYAAAQGLAVAGCIVALALEYRRARAPLPGHLAAVALVGSELACLVVPYSLAAYLGRPVAELWDAARVVRLLTWLSLAVIGWRSWCSGSLGSVSVCSWRRLSPRSGRPGTPEPPHAQRVRYWPRGSQNGSGGSGAASAGPG